ncbi:MAG: tetratricopeptide repeat protein [Treponema sp.]|jgi:tetratricopeptide (TPR) repeat protein|nr:tetratricopeptide repeat protein [Treponema sp.]
MPSLSALREFKASFDNTGGQKAVMEANNIPFDDLELPGFEPEPMDIGRPAGKAVPAGKTGIGEGPVPRPDVKPPETAETEAEELAELLPEDEPPPQPAKASPAPFSGGDFDFGALTGTNLDDLPPPPSHDELLDTAAPGGDAPPEEGINLDDELAGLGLPDEMDILTGTEPSGEVPSTEAAAQEDEDYGIPDDLLSGLSEELDAAPSDDFQEGPAAGTGDSADLDADNGDFDLGGDLDLDSLGGTGGDDTTPGEEPEGGELDLGNLDDFSLPEDTAGGEAENFDVGNLDDFNLPGSGSDADGFDNFDPGMEGQEPEPGTDTGTMSAGDAIGGDEDFSLPGIDDKIEEPRKGGGRPAAVSGAGRRRPQARKKTAEESDNIEEIRLGDEDLEQLRKTLSGYPLNLRIACEELIAEQAVPPEQMAKLVRMLIRNAPAKETAALAGQILGKTIAIPKGFEKSTGAALEAEQASFAYIFVHHFLPVLRLFLFIAAVAGSLFYLGWQFIYRPMKAESYYRAGHERIFAGEYERANERFSAAFDIHRDKKWFYTYAEAFRDQRQYRYAESKYDELLRHYPRDKKGVLDYANLETYYLRNYDKADKLLRHEIIDYAPDDPDALLALGDNSLAWGETDASKYEDARFSYARLLEKYGWTAPVVERMMKFFIRTDNLKEVIPLKNWFEGNPKRKLSAAALAELGGYLLDKQLEESRGVRDEYIEHISGVRALLLEAVLADPALPEGHYHLARYYHSLGNTHEERITLELAIRTFDNAREESVRRLNYRIDAHQRYADVLINSREFIPAEEQLVKGINLYEDALNRRLMSRSAKYGRLYAGLGDLEYFTKTGDMEITLGHYHRARQNGYAPPEIQYRMGAAYYQREDWRNALEYFFSASSSLPLNRRLLFALGNAALKQGDNFAAEGYYNRLLDILESQRSRLPVLLPNDRPEYLELAERLMMARNNAGVAYEALADQTGDRRYRTRALALYAEADRAWDARTRDPRTMIRSGSTPLPYLNSRNALYPRQDYEPQLFIRVDRDVLEPSLWEELAPLAALE